MIELCRIQKMYLSVILVVKSHGYAKKVCVFVCAVSTAVFVCVHKHVHLCTHASSASLDSTMQRAVRTRFQVPILFTASGHYFNVNNKWGGKERAKISTMVPY